jgi:hypothetical protein
MPTDQVRVSALEQGALRDVIDFLSGSRICLSEDDIREGRFKTEHPGLIIGLLRSLVEKGALIVENRNHQQNWSLTGHGAELGWRIETRGRVALVPALSEEFAGSFLPADTTQSIEGRQADNIGGEEQKTENEPSIPAADRFVYRSDNEQAFSDAISSLDALAEELPKSNSVFANREERLAVASEFKGLAESMRSGVARVAALFSISSMLAWIAKEALGGVIGDAAAKGLAAIRTLIGAVS